MPELLQGTEGKKENYESKMKGNIFLQRKSFKVAYDTEQSDAKQSLESSTETIQRKESKKSEDGLENWANEENQYFEQEMKK